MKNYKKRIIQGVLGALLVALICFSGWAAYVLVWGGVKQNFYNVASNDIIGTIINEVQTKGEIIINTDKGQIILVPKVGLINLDNLE